MVASSAVAVLKPRSKGKGKGKSKSKGKPKRRSRPAQRGSSKGAEIRARIAANRARRLAIADAMKCEAGVTEHTVHKEDFGGLAYIGTGRILSPEGRKILQLCTLAHECGHIFLHNSGSGYWLPGHVKELEAESYMHQAFREHGMTVPRRISQWGRAYVGSWIAKDRAAGISIDPRAEAYAAGRRSPYEPLRMVPSTWRIFRAEAVPVLSVLLPTPTAAAEGSWTGRLMARVRERLAWLTVPRSLADEARAVLWLVAGWLLYGTLACHFGMKVLQNLDLLPEAIPSLPGTESEAELLTRLLATVGGGLVLTNLALLWRTATRRGRILRT